MHKVNFMCGMQRSGSTLLSCLLNQNPDVYSSKTSPLLEIVAAIGKSIDYSLFEFTFDPDSVSKKIIPSTINSFYQDIDKPIIFDKHRGWLSALHLLDEFYPNPKILCTVRPVPESITSFFRLIENDNRNIIDKTLREEGKPLTITNRAECIMDRIVGPGLNAINNGISYNKDYIHFVEYNELVSNPQETMDKIYDFLEVPSFKHNFLDVENTCKEDKDSNWGMKDLHVIRSCLEKKSTPPEEVLGKELTKYYSQFNIKYS